MRPVSQSTMSGSSLIEILMVTAVLGCLLAIAVPSMAKMVYAQRCNGLVFSFLGSLKTARSEAIKRNKRVVMCKSSDGVSCAFSGGWDQGWVVFQDNNNNAQREPGEELIALRGPVDGLRFIGNRTVTTYVSYSPLGDARLASTGGFQAGTFVLCAPAYWGVDVREIVLSPTGNVRSVKAPSGACG